jgi:hypothetical protein
MNASQVGDVVYTVRKTAFCAAQLRDRGQARRQGLPSVLEPEVKHDELSTSRGAAANFYRKRSLWGLVRSEQLKKPSTHASVGCSLETRFPRVHRGEKQTQQRKRAVESVGNRGSGLD